jgi:hypothetical protein
MVVKNGARAEPAVTPALIIVHQPGFDCGLHIDTWEGRSSCQYHSALAGADPPPIASCGSAKSSPLDRDRLSLNRAHRCDESPAELRGIKSIAHFQ